MKSDIDGYVSKDSLYRLISKIRLQDSIITQEQANFICDKIAELPDEKSQEMNMCKKSTCSHNRRRNLKMDEWQNKNGTWSEAEPIKASWEDNKILTFFRELLSKDKCFREHKDKDGKCHGLYGGDRFTDYLSYGCIGCKHLDLIVRDKKVIK